MFSNRFTTSIAGATLAATFGIALIAAGSANADAIGDTYLASLAQAGIPQIAPDKAILAGHAVCQNLHEGADPDYLLADFVAKNVFATKEQDRAMLVASMTAFCPQYLPRLQS